MLVYFVQFINSTKSLKSDQKKLNTPIEANSTQLNIYFAATRNPNTKFVNDKWTSSMYIVPAKENAWNANTQKYFVVQFYNCRSLQFI